MTLKVITSLVLCFSVYCVFNTSILIQCVVKDSEIFASDLKKKHEENQFSALGAIFIIECQFLLKGFYFMTFLYMDNFERTLLVLGIP